MPYNNAVPQLNQTVASTTDPIRNNFAFLDTGIGQEHNFNAIGSGSDMYHLRASMPNQADPVALPAGTNGMYYVSGTQPKYYNAVQAGGLLIPAANALIQFNGSGAFGPLNAGGNAIRTSFNINPVTSTHDNTGLYTITFNTALASANYLVLCLGMRSTSGEVFASIVSDGVYSDNLTTTFVKIGFQSSSGNNRDVLMGAVYIFGA